MRSFLISTIASALIATAYSQSGNGQTTRGWSCCKNSCSWDNKARVDRPVLSCDANDNILDNAARRDGCESGGGAYACSDLSPWAANADLAYGFAAVNLASSNETSWCCACYSLTFTSGPVNGKKMIVQVTNTGYDLAGDQFNLAIPGAGEGSIQGCTKQYGRDVFGSDYGGVAHREDCEALPPALQAGCYWRFDWFRNADNPSVKWEKVSCPQQLAYVSNCRRQDDPIGGSKSPAPTPTSSAPISQGTVQPGGQCGGRTYKGPTRCVGGSVCTFVDENSYYCLADPAATRSTATTTTTPKAQPTIMQPWDQCGGATWTGPTRCQDSECVRVDQWYSQCQPISAIPSPKSTSAPVSFQAPSPTPSWQSTRTRRTFSGSESVAPPTPIQSPTGKQTSSKPLAPAPTVAQLYDQCGGRTYTGPTRCVEGLICVKVDDFYSQCQKS